MLYDRGTGWCDWELDNFKDRISYIDDFPFNMIKALTDYFETGKEQSVEFNAEGWFYSFKFSSNVTVGEKIIYDDTVEFANDFLNEIEENLESWAHFPSGRKNDEDYTELVDEIVKLRMYLLDEGLINKWIQIIS